jgi:hypothetical protein
VAVGTRRLHREELRIKTGELPHSVPLSRILHG